MAYKRNRGSGSESDFYCKKVNLQTTPEKIIEFAEWENMLEQSESNVLREDLRSQSTGLQACNKKCEENAEQIERLERRVAELKSTNLKLKDQITKLEVCSREHNLIIKGVPETGPNEKTKDIVADFLQNNLQIDDSFGDYNK